MMERDETIRKLWGQLYGHERTELDGLLDHLSALKESFSQKARPSFPTGGLVYCVYGDAFGDLDGLAKQLPRLKTLGVTILWLLPILESPGRDQGFDISDYSRVDPRFGGNEALRRLLAEAGSLNIALVFDVAVNHTSEQHPWFLAAQSPGSVYRDYYYWSDTGREYELAPLIFPGLVDSNWTWRPEAGAWNFHRFYPFQPDLNYHHPRVASEMARILCSWKAFGIDGFRMDAAALMWKQDGTDCDALPQVHLILKLWQACLDFLSPGSLLLAEANGLPKNLLPYFGDGDECKAAYHFDLMPKLYQSMLDRDPVRLTETDFPQLPPGCAWFTFLRLHDEVTLDLVPPEDRPPLVQAYLKAPDASFREGQAFSGRLFELFNRNVDKTLLAWSLLFSLPGTPILYYGDEIGMKNNIAYFERMTAQTGFRDSRFLHRGPWDTALELQSHEDPASSEGQLRRGLEAMLVVRRDHPDLLASTPILKVEGSTLTSIRQFAEQRLTIVNDLDATTHLWSLE